MQFELDDQSRNTSNSEMIATDCMCIPRYPYADLNMVETWLKHMPGGNNSVKHPIYGMYTSYMLPKIKGKLDTHRINVEVPFVE
jgi:hypothetical protein